MIQVGLTPESTLPVRLTIHYVTLSLQQAMLHYFSYAFFLLVQVLLHLLDVF